MTQRSGQELIDRYKRNYGIPLESDITEGMILRHWELERRLRGELLESTPDNRWDVFERCYGELYGELCWLTELTNAIQADPPHVRFGNWVNLIGSPPQKIYEVGSGKGELIGYLASCGNQCKASEITDERGEKWASAHPNLTWGVSDGIHLGRFEPAGHYDAVISNVVIEHLHPDDLLNHFRGVHTILKHGGRYFVTTSHVSVGPSDISSVFGRNSPMGMHLKEYTYREIACLLKEAGFFRISSVLRLPIRIRRLLGGHTMTRVSSSYLSYLCVVEDVISILPRQYQRRLASRVLKLILFAPNIMVVGTKPEAPMSGDTG